MKLDEHWMSPFLLSLALSSSSHYIVIIVSMHLLLPLHLSFQLIGFSYYSMFCYNILVLPSPWRTSLYLIQVGSGRAKKKKKTLDRQEANRRRRWWWWCWKNRTRPTTSRCCLARLMSTDDDGWLLRTTLQDVKQRYSKSPRTER